MNQQKTISLPNQQLLSTLENSRNYTIAVADAMPEGKFNATLVEGNWNFRELLHHIAYGIQWWEANYVKGVKTDWDPTPTKANKKEVIKYLNDAYNALQQTISKEKLSEEKLHGFHSTLDHITHHRGQAVLFLRSQGIPATEYTY